QRLPWVEGTNEISTPTGLCPIARSSSCGRNQMTNNARDVSESSRNPVGVSVLPVCTPTLRSPAVAGQRWALGRSPVGAQKCPNSTARRADIMVVMQTQQQPRLRRSDISDSAQTGLEFVRVDQGKKISVLRELGKAGGS